jgi:hypothetical protein
LSHAIQLPSFSSVVSCQDQLPMFNLLAPNLIFDTQFQLLPFKFDCHRNDQFSASSFNSHLSVSKIDCPVSKIDCPVSKFNCHLSIHSSAPKIDFSNHLITSSNQSSIVTLKFNCFHFDSQLSISI